MCSVEAVILYGAEVWAEALRKENYSKRIAAVQRRGSLRIACFYRTVTKPAVLVVAGIILIDLLAQERQFVHQQRYALGKEEISWLARSTSIETWQSRCDREPRGRWTARLVNRLDTWLNKEAGVVDFFLTQFLTGHGLFYSYLAKMRKVADRKCPYSDSIIDDAHHTFSYVHGGAPNDLPWSRSSETSRRKTLSRKCCEGRTSGTGMTAT
ncbi:uncharacterized protein LOC124432140 [Vespa crabro]|uniref:uncharacterized protein LOC124432140 n=1 Tax=Vespa crabro TaxID=7445 RepID=UPI001F03048B|nr:uncharacterized protein LOC124432140 [Vespa crabro]